MTRFSRRSSGIGAARATNLQRHILWDAGKAGGGKVAVERKGMRDSRLLHGAETDGVDKAKGMFSVFLKKGIGVLFSFGRNKETLDPGALLQGFKKPPCGIESFCSPQEGVGFADDVVGRDQCLVRFEELWKNLSGRAVVSIVGDLKSEPGAGVYKDFLLAHGSTFPATQAGGG